MRKRESRSRKAVPALAAAALAMAVAAAGPEGASAYFTTYVSAGGSQALHLGTRTELTEEVSDMTKHISVRNTSQANSCYVRVKVFYGSQLEISYTDQGSGLWRYSEADGYWYYGQPLAPGAATETLDAKILLPEGFDKDSFNVVVVQECTPVAYDAAGNPQADWTAVYTEYRESGQPGEGDEGQ